ncbi:MAG TPA: aspartate kinase [Fibrobacteria bacterium]|nr:aspartate kinase [Fibrobacteria bacterium]HOX51077.1 aspartate kinase [Fibrobacteria bacterium]
MTIACKFGGTSLADAAQFRKVAGIVKADPERRAVVVSAPGKRNKQDPKITDILLSIHDLVSRGLSPDPSFSLLRERYLDIEKELEVDAGMAEQLKAFQIAVLSGADRDWIASRGEHFSARIMAAFLGGTFVDPENAVFINSLGLVDDRTWTELPARLPREGICVMPGFYGTGPQGKVKTFSRGGSDISGAILARAAGARLYENWTDVSGLLMADPRIVADASPMEVVTYRELRELAYSGANVFHEEAILPCKQAAIPIRIANTNRPSDPGTLIVPEDQAADRPIAGVAGRSGFCLLQIEKVLMNKERGFGRRVLGILETNGVSYELSPSGIDSMCVVIDAEDFAPVEEVVLEEIRRSCEPDAIDVERDMALIATVGRGMSHRTGVASRLFGSLADAGVNVRIIDQGASEISIIVGVSSGDLSRGIRAIYDAFVRN